MEHGHQAVNCGVNSCKYNDHAMHCTLNDIIVGSDSVTGDAHTKQETECASFEGEGIM